MSATISASTNVTQSGTPVSQLSDSAAAADTDRFLVTQTAADGTKTVLNQPIKQMIGAQIPAGAALLAAGPGAARGGTASTGDIVAAVLLDSTLEIENGKLAVNVGTASGSVAAGDDQRFATLASEVASAQADSTAAQSYAASAVSSAAAAVTSAAAATSSAAAASTKADAAVATAGTALPASSVGAANGAASLGADSKIPIAQIPVGSGIGTVAAGDDGRFSSLASGVQAASAAAAASVQPSALGAANGAASLGADSKIPVAQIPVGAAAGTVAAGDDGRFASLASGVTAAASAAAASLQPASIGAANGVAGLGVDSKIPISQIPLGTETGMVAAGDDARFTSLSDGVASLTSTAVLSTSAGTLGDSTLRPPTQYDDSTVGHIVGDLWQFAGKAWQASSVAPGAAVWAPMAVSGLPGDISGALFAGGTRRVVTGYAGNLLDVTTTVGGTATVTTIGQDANGNLNRATLSAVLLAQDSGTYGTVTQVYNQVAGSSAGNAIGGLVAGATPQVGAPNGPRIGIVKLGGYDAMSWGESNGPSSLVLPNISLPANQLFVGALGAWHSTNDAAGVQPNVLSFGGLTAGTPLIVAGMAGGWAGTLNLSSQLWANNVTIPFSFDAKPSASVLSFGDQNNFIASGREVYNEKTLIATGTTMTGFSFGYISGNSSGNSGLAYLQTAVADMRVTALVIAQKSPARVDVDAFRANAAAFMGYTPQARGQLVLIGDSRTQGVNTGDGLSWSEFLTGQIAKFHLHNFAVSGATTGEMLGAVPQAITLGRPGERKIMHIWLGINDRLQNLSLTTAIANISSIVAQAQAAGFRISLQDEVIGDSSDNLTLRNLIKAAVDSGSIYVDSEVDPFATGLPLSDQTNATFWSTADHIHPYTDGHKVLGPFNATWLNTLADS